ncbi:MAG: alpha-glucan family phosphorylase [Planctomycetota bacterium]
MMQPVVNTRRSPRLTFEISWEVCNMVGGIHTVLATKAERMRELYGDDYVVIGPWLRTDANPAFLPEDVFPGVRDSLAAKGIGVHTGRWNVPGRPRCLLVDFSSTFKSKNEVLEWMWVNYGVDSISGGWDYVEPVLFGYTCGQVIQEFVRTGAVALQSDIVAQWHEWMVGSGLLYLKKQMPEIAHVFTTHATVMGRAISGSGASLGSALTQTDATERARALGITAKASLEAVLARESDAFTTVSPTTAREAKSFLGRVPDGLLLNALGENFPNPRFTDPDQRQQARSALLRVASAVTGTQYGARDLLLLTSGRYEFINKGIDVVIEALGHLAKRRSGTDQRVICFFCTPADTVGPDPAVERALREGARAKPGVASHLLRHTKHDPTLNGFAKVGLENRAHDPVHVVFVPIYLDGRDSLFPHGYYELLAAFDLTIFPSHYEPWGYTPLESIGYGIPTVTSDLAGFGQWASTVEVQDPRAAFVLPREHVDRPAAALRLGEHLADFVALAEPERKRIGAAALALSRRARWESFAAFYEQAHDSAIAARRARFHEGMPEFRDRARLLPAAGPPLEFLVGDRDRPHMISFTVHNRIPRELAHLRELSQNLWWSWNPEAEALFRDLDPDQWRLSGHNPVQLLDDLSQRVFDTRAADRDYLARLERVHADFQRYLGERVFDNPVVAYFCMEYGVHESLPLYSGGLGILAGDHLKAASDAGIPLVAVGLAYRAGYFRQRLDAQGQQRAETPLTDLKNLPLKRVRDERGEPVTVTLHFPGRDVFISAWVAKVGSVSLYLLDSELDANAPRDRKLTEQLYSGDNEWRLQQEIVLGVGGRTLLRTIGLKPEVFHLNEGHAAFLVLSRVYELATHEKLDFAAALEVVRRTSVFTTHTPVAAGHDAFPEEMVRPYFSPYEGTLHATWEQIMGLGRNPGEGASGPFSMTLLGLRGASHVNGVSRIHAEVSRRNFAAVAPGYHPSELPIEAITNGVHGPTWVADAVQALLRKSIGPHAALHSKEACRAASELPDTALREVRLELKRRLLRELRLRVESGGRARGDSPAQRQRILAALDERALVVGFARRFAPYKRATLLFRDPKALARITSQPVIFLFAGKAHPSDGLGQQLIRQVYELSRQNEFIGKVILLENYEISLARTLVQGCDVWLNTPTPPLEASGTSGMKAAMNGVLNLSIADGWWAESYDGKNGWVIGGQRICDSREHQDEFDSHDLYQLLETEVLPLYFSGTGPGLPAGWLERSRAAMASTLHRFSAARMIDEYQSKFYVPSAEESSKLRQNEYREARAIGAHKQKLRGAWRDIRISEARVSGIEEDVVHAGDRVSIWASVQHPGLAASDLRIEFVVSEPRDDGWVPSQSVRLDLGTDHGHASQWQGYFEPSSTGSRGFGIRVVPRFAPEANGVVDLEIPLAKWA